MSGIFPKAPFIPFSDHDSNPACYWIMPSMQRRDHFSVYKRLPAGMPDYLLSDTSHSEDGTERCTAAIYSCRAYVIHFEFKPRSPSIKK